jgi:SAM-dependent methyltransferase
MSGWPVDVIDADDVAVVDETPGLAPLLVARRLPLDAGTAADEAYHDQEASGYDDSCTIPRVAAAEGWIVPWIRRQTPPGITVDLGCGTGRVTRALAGGGRVVIAVDRSTTMLEVARRQVPSEQTGANLLLLIADFLRTGRYIGDATEHFRPAGLAPCGLRRPGSRGPRRRGARLAGRRRWQAGRGRDRQPGPCAALSGRLRSVGGRRRERGRAVDDRHDRRAVSDDDVHRAGHNHHTPSTPTVVHHNHRRADDHDRCGAVVGVARAAHPSAEARLSLGGSYHHRAVLADPEL